MDLKQRIRSFPDWPKKGVIFRDISPLLKDPEAFEYVLKRFMEKYGGEGIDLIAGIEARGFIFGGALARLLKKPFVMVRKKGKLPGRTRRRDYLIEYGSATIELQEDAVAEGQRVLIVDDLLATGGTVAATAALIEQLGGVVVGIAFVIELAFLKGREKLSKYDLLSLVVYD